MVFKRMKSSPVKYDYNKGKICKVKDCNHIAKAKGFCLECYHQYVVKGKKYEVNKSESD